MYTRPPHRYTSPPQLLERLIGLQQMLGLLVFLKQRR